MTRYHATFLLGALALLGPEAGAQAAIEPMLPGLDRVTAVSADGSVIVGSQTIVVGSSAAGAGVVLDASGTILLASLPPGTDVSALNGVSDDGSTFVGVATSSGGPLVTNATRWDGIANPVVLDPVNGSSRSVAAAISGDGAFVVGSSDSLATRWDASGNAQVLGPLPSTAGSSASATNQDGSVVVGSLYELGFGFRTTAFRWTEAGGITLLEAPQGFPYCRALDVSDDGRTVLGIASSAATARYRICLWTDSTVPTVLHDVPVSWFYYSASLSADGQTVVGSWRPQSGEDHPYVWTVDGGYEDLEPYLRRYGLHSADVIPSPTLGVLVSGDQRTLIGTWAVGGSGLEHWRATNGTRDQMQRVVCSAPALNSTGHPATLSVAGTPFVTANEVALRVHSLPPNALTMFLTSRSIGASVTPMGSVGSICLRGPAGRFDRPGEVRAADAAGWLELPLDLGSIPGPGGPIAVLAGESWYYQAVYRDSLLGSPTFNFSSAAEVVYR